MENPYLTPKTRVCPQNERVIDLLVEYKHQMKVLNMLRQEGMAYDEARSVVAESVELAQAELLSGTGSAIRRLPVELL